MYTYLILGGASLVGRNLVRYLVENNLASRIRVVDRVLLKTGYFSERFLKAFDKVEYIQCNLNNPETVKKAFEYEGGTWDVVVNAALETKNAQPKEIYEERILNLSIIVAKEAVAHNTKVLIHVSNSQVYNPKKAPSTESDELKAKCLFSKYFVKAEEAVRNIGNLNAIIIRPAILYGPGDTQYITPILVLARVYQHLNEPMPSVWKKEFKLNLVHVLDMARAIVHTSKWYIENNKSGLEIFNITDGDDTDSCKIQSLVSKIFNIEVESPSSIILSFLKSNLDQFLDEANEKHIEPWAELLRQHQIANSPLIPYVDSELVNQSQVWMDNSKLLKTTNFEIQIKEVTEDLLKEVIKEFIEMKIWPGKLE